MMTTARAGASASFSKAKARSPTITSVNAILVAFLRSFSPGATRKNDVLSASMTVYDAPSSPLSLICLAAASMEVTSPMTCLSAGGAWAQAAALYARTAAKPNHALMDTRRINKLGELELTAVTCKVSRYVKASEVQALSRMDGQLCAAQLGLIASLLSTPVTPFTFLAIFSTFAFSLSLVTLPVSTTTPLWASTEIGWPPTSESSAIFTLT